MAQDYRLTALERAISNRSTREYAKLGKGLSRGMRGLSARGLIGSSEQEELLADIAERKSLVESESTAARDMLRDQITQEEEAKAGANLRNAFSIGGTLLGALAGIPGGPAGMMTGASFGSAAGKILGGATTGTWDPTAANDIVQGFGNLNQVDPVDELDKKLKLIRMYTAGGPTTMPLDVGTSFSKYLLSGDAVVPDNVDRWAKSDGTNQEWLDQFLQSVAGQ